MPERPSGPSSMRSWCSNCPGVALGPVQKHPQTLWSPLYPSLCGSSGISSVPALRHAEEGCHPFPYFGAPEWFVLLGSRKRPGRKRKNRRPVTSEEKLRPQEHLQDRLSMHYQHLGAELEQTSQHSFILQGGCERNLGEHDHTQTHTSKTTPMAINAERLHVESSSVSSI